MKNARMRWLVLLMVIVATVGLAACIQGEAVATPPEIHYGEDMCASCGMVISDPRFAAGLAWEIEPGRYESLPFDDIGDLVGYLRDHTEKTIVDSWVHDYTTEEWIDAATAWYVLSPEIHSPMMHGVAAFATAGAAQAMAPSVQGEVYDWNHMRAQVLMHNH